MKKILPWLALLLIVLWLVARMALALTGLLLHVLWILALVAFFSWIVSFFIGRSK